MAPVNAPFSWPNSSPSSHSNALQQDFVVEWFGQELHRPRSQRLHPHADVAVGRNEDGRNRELLSVERRLKVEARHTWHADICNQARRRGPVARLQEFLGR